MDYKEIMFNLKQLRLEFDNCHSINFFSKKSKVCIDKVFKLIFSKTIHLRFR